MEPIHTRSGAAHTHTHTDTRYTLSNTTGTAPSPLPSTFESSTCVRRCFMFGRVA